MPGLHDMIPGLREIEDNYKETQLESFLGIEPAICGLVEVKPFTPQMYLELTYAGNRCFVGDAYPSASDIVQFLWRVSVVFERDNPEKKQMFTAALGLYSECKYGDYYHGILDYISKAWIAMPQWTIDPSRRKSMGVWISSVVDNMASQYNWSEEQVMNCPFRRLWQYFNRMMERSNPDYTQTCPQAIQMIADWLEERNRK